MMMVILIMEQLKKVFQNKEDANAYAKERELNTLGTDYSVTEMKIE